ncbi:alpha/beta hydrolase [Kordiimonadales bacterium JCM 17843]|nr:alpha/beta hydrolase [Iodidimonas muriae]GER06749.1 alpha/beta hydrolase [Kordiimonadales bacterium JCM 17843]
MTDRGWFEHPLPAPKVAATEILWLHGWGQTGASLMGLAGLFTAKARNRVVDLPGFGNTPMLAKGAGTADYADALHQWLDSGPKRILVGHSYGGRVAIQYAARYPDKVAAVILIAGAGLKRRRSLSFRIRAFFLRMMGKAARACDRLFGTKLAAAYAARFGSADYRKAGDLRPTFLSAVNEDLSEQAQSLRCPTLLIYGALDDATPPEIGEKYAALISGAEYHCLKGFGHLDILGRGIWQCQTLIDRFLERHSS